jgi:glycine cleavage system H lipoate-binding protein
MTGAAMSQVGEAEDVSLPEAGESVSGGDILFSCEGSTGSYDWACPLDATIKAVNPRVVEEPGTLNEDSLEEGWLVKLEGLDESQVSSFCKKGKA